jgi:hypothetical protein
MIEQAEGLMHNGLSAEQLELLQGPITSRASELPKGTKTDPTLEESIKSLVESTKVKS